MCPPPFPVRLETYNPGGSRQGTEALPAGVSAPGCEGDPVSSPEHLDELDVAARDHRHLGRCTFYFGNYFVYPFPWVIVFVPAFFYIAPNAANIAATQAYKIGCLALVITLALQSVKMLHYREHLNRCE